MTGTISTGMPASTQSIRFWQESSLYRKLPVAVIVKIDIGRAMRSARSRPEQLHHLDHPRHAVLGEGARHDRLLRVGQGHVQAPRVGDLGLDVVVGREGRGEVRRCAARPSPSRTYSTKSVEFARRVSPVRWSSTLQARRARARSGRGRRRGRRAASPSRSYSQNERRGARDGPLDDVAREQDPVAGRVVRQAAPRAAAGASPARGSPCRSRPGSASPRRGCGR